MVANRIPASTWLTLALAAVFQVAGCEGKSKTSGGGDDDSNGGSGARGGSMTGGKGGTTSLGGSAGGSMTGARGGTSTGGTSGEAGAPVGGQSQGGESQGGQPTAGEGGDAGQGADAGTGGSPEDPTVIGRVVDFWLQPLVNVPVTIGTTVVTTNGQGVFSVPSVAPTYDVSLVVTWPGGQGGSYAWRFEGLTRRDPTLQVYKGRQNRYGSFTLDPQGETLGASRRLSVTLAGPNGATFHDDISGTGLMTDTNWDGPPTTQVTTHGLVWEFDMNELPTVYRSYDVTSTALDEAATVRPVIALSLADETISSGSVSGTVTSSSNTERTNVAFARFAAGAAIRIVSDYPGPNTYSYVFPTLPSSTVTVAASEGDSYFGAFGIAHRDGLAAGQSGVALAIPDPMAQTMPATALTNVGPSTQFGWSGGAGPCVFHIENSNYYEGIFVVTSRRTIALPTFDGYTLRRGGNHFWRVERHGSASSVDALAGPQGYLDPFSVSDDFPYGPRTGDGTFSISTGRSFTTAP
jgi:hypothetical protein